MVRRKKASPKPARRHPDPTDPAAAAHAPEAAAAPIDRPATDRLLEDPARPTTSPSHGGSWKALALAALFVVAIAFAAFSNAMPSVAIHDDVFFVPSRHTLTWNSVGQIFRDDTWSATGSGAGTYRPLAILSIAVNGAMFGSDPAGYHATNVVLHVIASLGVFLLILELGARTRAARSSPDPWIWAAALAAAIFAVHPIHTEAVDSVFNRSEVLATIGVAYALWIIVRWHESRPIAAWIGASVLYLAALLCRESAVSLPVLAAAVLWILHADEPAKDRLQRIVPVAVLLLPLGEYFVLRSYSLAASGERAGPLLGVVAGDDFVSRVSYTAATLREYARMLVWPWPLRASYEDYAGGGIALSAIVHGVLVAAAVAARRSVPLVTIAVAFFYLSLIPSTRVFTAIGSALGAITLQNSLLIAERVAYLPSVAVAIAAAAVTGAITRRRGVAVAAVVVAPVLAAGLAVTTARNAQWHSATALFGAEVRAAPENGDGWRLYVSALSSAGRFDEAAAACDSQLDQPSRSAQLFNNCGVVYDKLARDEHAMKSYRRAIDLGLESVGHANLGRVYARLGRAAEAEAEFVLAIETEDNPAQKHYRTAVMLIRFHPERTADARRELEEALKLQPDFAAARQLLAQVRR